MIDTLFFDIASDNREVIIEECVNCLVNGSILIFPTETVYGICGLGNTSSVREIIALKQRQIGKPIPVLFSSLEKTVRTFGIKSPEWLSDFSRQFWPGPVTLVLGSSNSVHGISDSGFTGIRMPDQGELLEIIEGSGGFLAGTSANISGEDNSSDFDVITRIFSGRIPIIVKGPETSGVPSCVVKVTEQGYTVLRSGADILKIEDFFKKCRLNAV